ncbi:unnamed protein product [Albugo candida]|nr:unnamed protein product [Albugo candida]|eukprot:CCI45356.1 unnamed protein product [Albugo candida]
MLESGQIVKRVFQTFESHVPYMLQMFADYHIEGMNPLYLSNVKFRAPLPVSQHHLMDDMSAIVDTREMCRRIYLQGNVPEHMISSSSKQISVGIRGRHVPVTDFPQSNGCRQSSCSLELDVAIASVLNSRRFREHQISLETRGIVNNVPSLAVLWEEEKERRRMAHLDESPELPDSYPRETDTQQKRFFGSRSKTDVRLSQTLLSQSHFYDQMKTSLNKIMTKIINVKSEGIEEKRGHSEVEGDDLVPMSSQIHSPDTENQFSFSQNCCGMSDTKRAEEDLDILNFLLKMKNPLEDSSTGVELENEVADYRSDRSDESDKRNDAAEATAILESQRVSTSESPNHKSNATANRPSKWWEVSTDKSQHAADIGSSRINRASDRTKKLQKQDFFSLNAKSCSRKAQLTTDSQASETITYSREVWAADTNRIKTDCTQSQCIKSSQEMIHQSNTNNRLKATPDTSPILCLSKQRKRRKASIKRDSVQENKVWLYRARPPTFEELIESSQSLGILPHHNTGAFYSDPGDLPKKPLKFGGYKFQFTDQNDVTKLDRFDTSLQRHELSSNTIGRVFRGLDELISVEQGEHKRSGYRDANHNRLYTTAMLPPSQSMVRNWLSKEASSRQNEVKREALSTSNQINSSTSLSATEQVHSTSTPNITTLSVEVCAFCRGSLSPDPAIDAIGAIAYAISAKEGFHRNKTKHTGVIINTAEDKAIPDSQNTLVKESQDTLRFDANFAQLITAKRKLIGKRFCLGRHDAAVFAVSSEEEIFTCFNKVVETWDPDFLTGFEVQKSSIGYLVDRAMHLNINLIQTMSRLPQTPIDARNPVSHVNVDDKDPGKIKTSIGTIWGMAKASGLWIHGRHVINLWRVARSELKLARYSIEDIVQSVLQQTWPTYSWQEMSTSFREEGLRRWKMLDHLLDKAVVNLKLLSRMQFITRTSEMARLFGIDFYSVLSRGSQFRVEAVMLRVTKRNNFVLLSPSRNQVAAQAPMECIPLVMEPQSRYYSDPVVVLDFQSLYPSLVIAYNLCYSTYLGRLENGMKPELETFMGVTSFSPDEKGFTNCDQEIHIAPNGTLFCPKSRRRGIVPAILEEILATRIMIKHAMKKHQSPTLSKNLYKKLDARQLALKLIANVTYGYTAAGFSGRMPCAQLADAIVQTGRCTLEATVRVVESHSEWNARVVYGDTDSLFVLLEGRSKNEAFCIGQEIAKKITALNPRPVELKMEKVYFGCILVSKKRYVGYKYESLDQVQGELDAKGVEIVRRDSCVLVQKLMRTSLQLLFETRDLSRIKRVMIHLRRQMLSNQIPLRDYVFAKEVRLGSYADNSHAPPAALVSLKAMASDPRAEPRYAERVPYVVINGFPGARLIDLVISPYRFVANPSGNTINYQYYIEKQIIPSLERLFLLVGVNIRDWFASVSKVNSKANGYASIDIEDLLQEKPQHPRRYTPSNRKSIEFFYKSVRCYLCGSVIPSSSMISLDWIRTNALCPCCQENAQRSLLQLKHGEVLLDMQLGKLRQLCSLCTEGNQFIWYQTCQSLPCPIWNQSQILGDRVGRIISKSPEEEKESLVGL